MNPRGPDAPFDPSEPTNRWAFKPELIRYGPDFGTFSIGWQTASVQRGTPTVR